MRETLIDVLMFVVLGIVYLGFSVVVGFIVGYFVLPALG